MLTVKSWVRRVATPVVAGLAFVSGMAQSAWSQITNTPAGVSSTLTSGLGAAYDTAITIGVGAITIGLVVYMIRKGIKPR